MQVPLHAGSKASAEDIAQLERGIRRCLPASYVQFVAVNDGATPASNIINIADNQNASINRFIPVAQICKEKSQAKISDSHLIPIAEDGCGNLFLLNVETERVYFWDHESADPPIPVAESFADFLARMKSWDPASVVLKPGQVKSVWIDRDFLAKLKKDGT